jgi:hypothetical protein
MKTISIRGRKIRIFQGRETKQLDGVTSKRPKKSAWYWEPADYEGDLTWSRPTSSFERAVAAAEQATGG